MHSALPLQPPLPLSVPPEEHLECDACCCMAVRPDLHAFLGFNGLVKTTTVVCTEAVQEGVWTEAVQLAQRTHVHTEVRVCLCACVEGGMAERHAVCCKRMKHRENLSCYKGCYIICTNTCWPAAALFPWAFALPIFADRVRHKILTREYACRDLVLK